VEYVSNNINISFYDTLVKYTIKYFAEIGITKQSIIDSGEHISDFVRDEDIGGDMNGSSTTKIPRMVKT